MTEGSTRKIRRLNDEQMSADIFNELSEIQGHLDLSLDQEMQAVYQLQQKFYKARLSHFERRNALFGKIPRFWYTVMMNHPDFGNLIQDEEEDCLQYLESIGIKYDETRLLSYQIHFTFANNPYFENNVLSRNCVFVKDAGYTYSSSPICWRDGMSLMDEKADLSFFDWYVNVDYDNYAEMIREDLFVSPLKYYLTPPDDSEAAEDSSSDDSDGANSDILSMTVADGDDDEGGRDGGHASGRLTQAHSSDGSRTGTSAVGNVNGNAVTQNQNSA